MPAEDAEKPPKKLRDAVRARAREAYAGAILDAAERVLSRTGFSDAKMADIAREAGVSVGTLYQHFDSKEQVFVDLVDRGRRDFFAAMERELESKPPQQRLLATVRVTLSYMESRGALFAVYAQLGPLVEQQLRNSGGLDLETGSERLLKLLETILGCDASAGRIRTDLPARMMAGALLGMIQGVVTDWANGGRPPDLALKAEPLVALFVDGARPR